MTLTLTKKFYAGNQRPFIKKIDTFHGAEQKRQQFIVIHLKWHSFWQLKSSPFFQSKKSSWSKIQCPNEAPKITNIPKRLKPDLW